MIDADAADPAALLRELRDFALARAGAASQPLSSRAVAGAVISAVEADAFPLAFSSDVGGVALGFKPLLHEPLKGTVEAQAPVAGVAAAPSSSPSSSFSFSCTSCGRCCRSYASSILLDPHDIHRMTAAEAAATAATGSSRPGSARADLGLLRRFPGRFRTALGRFALAALPPASRPQGGTGSDRVLVVSDGGESGAEPFAVPIVAEGGLAPVVFLRPVDTGGGDTRCGFAVPAGPGPGPGSPPNAALVRSPAPLRCSLGPEGMPYACSLYPLGDFFTGTAARFYSVDSPLANRGGGDGARAGAGMDLAAAAEEEEACEGVLSPRPGPILVPRRALRPTRGAKAPARPPALSSLSLPPTPPSSTNSLAEYTARNGIPARREAAEWFRRLATAHACSGVETALVAAADAWASAASGGDGKRTRRRSPATPLALPASLVNALPRWLVDAQPPQQPFDGKAAAEALRARTAEAWYGGGGGGGGGGVGGGGAGVPWASLRGRIERDTAGIHREARDAADLLRREAGGKGAAQLA
jgi:hypothetical protein